MAAEDETTAVGRRGGSGRGRKQPTSKKDSSNSSSNSKKNADPVKTIYTSDEDSSEVSWKLICNVHVYDFRGDIFNGYL